MIHFVSIKFQKRKPYRLSQDSKLGFLCACWKVGSATMEWRIHFTFFQSLWYYFFCSKGKCMILLNFFTAWLLLAHLPCEFFFFFNASCDLEPFCTPCKPLLPFEKHKLICPSINTNSFIYLMVYPNCQTSATQHQFSFASRQVVGIIYICITSLSSVRFPELYFLLLIEKAEKF